ncbi:hypothetical protein [Methylocystis bryophila]|nr:hypothetical protein [Methylocystis bryophila]BDV39756.1 hypothetical protein DSM21852_30090 [Methylocystis bryophila]
MLIRQSRIPSPSLGLGESAFQLLEGRDGVSVRLGPYAHFFDRPGRSVSKWTGAKTTPRQSPHPQPQRSRIMRELALLARLLFGGGDVRINMIAAQNQPIEVLLTAGDGNVVECIDLPRLAREGAPPLLFLQTTYLCSSSNAFFRSVLSDASTASWARAPYVYKTYRQQSLVKPAILCLSGRTKILREHLEPGERRDFALGNIIALTSNVVSVLKPSNRYWVEEFRFPVYRVFDAAEEDSRQISFSSFSRQDRRRMFKEARAAAKTLLESIRAREGFFVCEVMNASDKPAYVYVQLNRSDFYGGSGLLGYAVRIAAMFLRSSSFLTGR